MNVAVHSSAWPHGEGVEMAASVFAPLPLDVRGLRRLVPIARRPSTEEARTRGHQRQGGATVVRVRQGGPWYRWRKTQAVAERGGCRQQPHVRGELQLLALEGVALHHQPVAYIHTKLS